MEQDERQRHEIGDMVFLGFVVYVVYGERRKFQWKSV